MKRRDFLNSSILAAAVAVPGIRSAYAVVGTAEVADLAAVTGWQVDGPGLVLVDRNGAPQLTLLGIGGPDATPSPSPSPTRTPRPTPTATPRSVAVPDVTGTTEADALVAFGAAGLTAGDRTRAYSGSVRSGRVIRTDRDRSRACTLVPGKCRRCTSVGR